MTNPMSFENTPLHTGRHFNELGCSHFDIVDELPILSVTAKGG